MCGWARVRAPAQHGSSMRLAAAWVGRWRLPASAFLAGKVRDRGILWHRPSQATEKAASFLDQFPKVAHGGQWRRRAPLCPVKDGLQIGRFTVIFAIDELTVYRPS